MLVCLQHLYNLVHVDLSYNLLRLLESAHTHLGNIKTLNLSGNQLDHLAGLSKLYSLVNLDLSHNQLAMVTRQRRPSHSGGSLQELMCVFPAGQDQEHRLAAVFGEAQPLR